MENSNNKLQLGKNKKKREGKKYIFYTTTWCNNFDSVNDTVRFDTDLSL